MAVKLPAIIFFVGFYVFGVKGQIPPAEKALIDLAPKIHTFLNSDSEESILYHLKKDFFYEKLASISSTHHLKDALDLLESDSVSPTELHLENLEKFSQTAPIYNVSKECSFDNAYIIESILGKQTWAIGCKYGHLWYFCVNHILVHPVSMQWVCNFACNYT